MHRIKSNILVSTCPILIFLILVPFMQYAQKPQEIFTLANKFYQEKEYDRAVELYDSLTNAGYKSTNTYFNAGNSYYKLQNFPAAILNYERAKLITGDRYDINRNLELSNLNVVDKIESLPEVFIFTWWRNFINSNSSRNWAIFSLLFLWLSMISIISFILFSNNTIKKLSFILFLILFVFTIFTILFTYKRFSFETEHDYAIVFAPNVYVKSAPDEESTDQFIIHEGLKVQMMEKVGEWQQIKLGDGKVGWLKEGAIEII